MSTAMRHHFVAALARAASLARAPSLERAVPSSERAVGSVGDRRLAIMRPNLSIVRHRTAGGAANGPGRSMPRKDGVHYPFGHPRRWNPGICSSPVEKGCMLLTLTLL